MAQADIVAITGSALINHSIERLLNLCRPESFVVVLGPTTPLSPVLFDHGVDVICGTRVVDRSSPRTALRERRRDLPANTWCPSADDAAGTMWVKVPELATCTPKECR